MPRILITGGTGYLGSELVRQALATGWEVAATYHSQLPTAHQVSWFRLDLRDQAACSRLLADTNPDIVIHTAYIQHGADLNSITADGSAAIAQAAKGAGCRLVHISSDALFDGEIDRPYIEADQPSPVHAYGRAKAAAEAAVIEAHPAAAVVRTSLIYGGERLSVHEETILAAAAGEKPFTFFLDEIRCPVQVGDLACALLALAITPYRGVLHIAGSEAVSRYQFAQLVATYYGQDHEHLRAATSPGVAGGRPRHCVLDSSYAQAMLGMRLRGVSEVLRVRD
jgi:dTDP-4-dehydrorhamnose reductase